MGINQIAHNRSLQNKAFMDNSHSILTTLSRDFLALCQAQVTLLTQSLNAAWVGVYLTEDSSKNSPSTNLIPAYFYPQSNPNLPFLSEQENQVLLLLNGQSKVEQDSSLPHDLETKINRHNQIIMPLLYEEIFMGLLVVRRSESPWNELELTQIEKIATSLAIARSLEKSNSWYQQKLRQLENFINFQDHKIDNLLHQLRNPLTALRTFAKLLLKRILPEDNNNKVVQNMLRESDRLRDLLQQFQQEEKSKSSLLELKGHSVEQTNFLLPAQSARETDLIAIVASLLDSAIAIAEEKKIKVEGHFGKNPVFVQGNSQAIREVVSNLIDNAIKYTPKGGQVKIELIKKEKYQGIKITDSGYGIPLEDQDHVFERNYRGVQQLGAIPGTGLGLAIVKELVEQMQGQIELISPNELNGTTFVVWWLAS